MARVIQVICDIHLNEKDEQVPADHEATVTWGKSKPRTIAACDDCYEQHILPFKELLLAHGQPEPTTQTQSREADGQASLLDAAGEVPTEAEPKWPCPAGCSYKGSRSNMRRHLVVDHETSLPVEEARLGHTLDGQELVFFCRAENCTGGFTHRQGRSAHERSEHGLNIKDDD